MDPNDRSETAQVKGSLIQPLDIIARNAYETRKTEIWAKIVECFRGKSRELGIDEEIMYMGVDGLNRRLSALRQLAAEYNEICNRLNTREPRINYGSLA